jgi:hypothetical protein
MNGVVSSLLDLNHNGRTTPVNARRDRLVDFSEIVCSEFRKIVRVKFINIFHCANGVYLWIAVTTVW